LALFDRWLSPIALKNSLGHIGTTAYGGVSTCACRGCDDGHQATKRELFLSISLDEYVLEDHLLRAVDRYLDLSEFRGNLAVSYSHTGRPSIDPELIARMLIIDYCYGIRSQRRLCE